MARAMIRIVLLGVVPIAALLTAAHYWVASGRYVTTDNAYVKANLISISAEVSGRVDRMFVTENTPVKAGQKLFSIDPEPFRIEVARAQAELDKVGNLIAALHADYRQAEMELKEAQADISYFKRVQHRTPHSNRTSRKRMQQLRLRRPSRRRTSMILPHHDS